MRLIISVIFFLTICLFGFSQTNLDTNNPLLSDKIQVYYKFYNQTDSTVIIKYSVSSSEIIEYSGKNNTAYIYFEIEEFDEELNSVIHNYHTKILAIKILPMQTYVIGQIKFPYQFSANKSLKINLISNSNLLLNSQTHYFEDMQNTNSIFVTNNNKTIEWNQPFAFQDTIIIHSKSCNPIIYYEITNNAYSTRDSVTCNNRDYKVISSEIGIYNFYSDSTYSKKIFVLPIVSNTFPLNNSPCEMLESMRVFYTKTSIDSLKNTSIGCKIELDKLWLQLCNFDEIRAKESIREYYTRVTLANKKYTSINYGMYTDRGICLILFGEPLTIKQSSDEEIWYYTKDADSDDKIFIFEKGKNMFTDYTLQSKKSKEIFFEQAKSNWYQGKPFNLKN
jgi:GWxTD domain-containing protein